MGYKVTNENFEKRKVRLCAMGNQQIAGVHFNESDLYAPVLKAPEVRLLMAIAARQGATLYKYDTSQAFLYGDVEEDLYARAPDTACSPERTSTGPDKQPGHGTSACRPGWKTMGTFLSTMRRPSS